MASRYIFNQTRIVDLKNQVFNIYIDQIIKQFDFHHPKLIPTTTQDEVGIQQFGVLTKRSATDHVWCIVHAIEEARIKKWTATFVTLDFQSAFDAVLTAKEKEREGIIETMMEFIILTQC